MANVTIDKVQVDVEASAKGTSQVFSQLEKQLTTLRSALSSINTKNLSQIANINTAGMSKAEKDISSSVNKIKQSLAGLEALKNSALSGDTSSLTSFNRRVVAIQSGIDTLREKMAQVGATTVESSQFTILKNQSEELDTKLTELKAKMTDFKNGNITLSSSEFTVLTDDIKDTSAALDEVNDKIKEMRGNGTAFVNADTLTAELESAKAEVDDFVNTTNNAKPQLDTSGIVESLGNIASQASEATSRLLTLVGRGVVTGISSITSGLSRMRSAISNIGKVSSYSSSMFGKILRYGFGIRSLYVLFRRLRQAVKDSFTELQNSGAEFQTTRANIEALKNSLTTLKYQFGAAFEPIFNTIAPALQTLINYLIAAMNTLSAFIAKITGRSTYSKVAAVTTKVASGAGSAAKAVGELNKQLQGFDELNNLDLDSGSGGSGGGGGSSSGGDVTYEEASVESALGDFANSLADMIKAGNWEGVGSAISEKITDALNGINWTTIKSKASAFGTNLANFLNGFINTDLFSSIGTTLAEALNTAFTSANSFAKTFDWVNLGTSIGTGITQFFTTADFGMWGETIHDWIGGILDAGIALLDNTDFNEIGKKLGDFIESLQVSDILGKVKTLCSKIITAMGNVLTGFQNNTSEKAKLETAIGGLLGVLAITKNVPLTLILGATIGGVELGGKLYEWASGNTVNQSFTEEVKDIFDGLFGENKIKFDLSDCISFVIGDLTSGPELSKLRKEIYTIFSTALVPAKIFGEEYFRISIGDWIVFDGVSDVVNSIMGIGEKLASAITSIWSGQTYSEAMVGANGMSSEAAQNTMYKSGLKQKLQDLGKQIPAGIKEGITLALAMNPFGAAILAMKDKIIEKIEEVFKIGSPARAMYDSGKYIFLGIVQGFINAMNSYSWSDLAKDLYDHFNQNSSNKMTGSASGKIGYDFSNTTATLTINTKMTGQAKSKADVDNLKTSFRSLNTEASKGANATYNANVGGKIAEIADLDTWKQKFTSLYEKWQSKSATMRTYVGGQMESIDDTTTWSEKIKNLLESWVGKSVQFGASIGGSDSQISNIDGLKPWQNTIDDFRDNHWKGKNAAFGATAGSEITNWSNWSGYTKLCDLYAKWYGRNAGFGASATSDVTGWQNWSGYKALCDLYAKWYGRNAEFGVTLNSDISGSDSWITNLINKISDKLNTKVNQTLNGRALGGIIGPNGSVRNLPQYAGGTLNAGSVFVAGEAGPEVMGHINGRTEILNRSQIGSIIHSSFVSAMSQFGNRMLATPESISYNSNSYSGYSGTNSDGNAENKYLLAEQNALLREQNELLAQILEKPTGISSREAFNAVRGEANNYYRRTGNGAFLS